MDFNTKTVLTINKDDNYLELEVGDYVTVWFKNGQCWSIEVINISDEGMTVKDEDNKIRIIFYSDIEDIEEG